MGLCGQKASLGSWDPSAQRQALTGVRLVPKGVGISLGGVGMFNQKELKSPWAEPQDKPCARDLTLLTLILSTASETRSLLLILQVRKRKLKEAEQYAQGHKASSQQTRDANSDNRHQRSALSAASYSLSQ